MIVKQFHYITREESERLINALKLTKHKVIVLLMLDAGLRISEACSIKYKNFDFKNRTITIQSAKKRGQKDLRTVPISNRLYQALGDYFKQIKIEIQPNAYLFPSSSGVKHLTRKTMWLTLHNIGKKIDIANLHPHTLRHSFATHHLSAGTSLAEIKEMLGHKSYDTTLIYAEIPTEELRQRVNTVTSTPPTIWAKIYNYIIPSKPNKLINIDFNENYFTIGRNNELMNINVNLSKSINTLLIGGIGSGKSHILSNIQSDKKIMRLDDTDNIKKSLANILLYIFKDKETVLAILWKDFTTEEINKRIQRENAMNLCDTIIANLKPKEYILIIDDITSITPSAKRVLEKLKETFILVVGAREIKAQNTSFLWNFEKVQLDNLKRKDAVLLINQLASNLEVENKEVFINHVYDQTNGNPRAINELIARYKKEPFLDIQTIREIKHTGALREIDMTWTIIVSLGLIACMRYFSTEMDEPILRLIGALAMIALFLIRPMLTNLKRKFI